MMTKISYRGYRFRPEIIQHAIWLYVRFTLSFRDIEDLLAERGIVVSHETVRRWVNHFGPAIAADLRKRRPKPHTIWHLDEVYLRIGGRLVYLWRAVDAEGEVLDVLLQTKRNKRAALKLMRKLLKTSIAIRLFSEENYIRYMRGLGIIFIIGGVTMIGLGYKFFRPVGLLPGLKRLFQLSKTQAFSPRVRKFFEHDPNNGRPRYRNVQRKTAAPAIRMVVSN
jgi:DDE domain